MHYGLEQELALSGRSSTDEPVPMEFLLGAFEGAARKHVVHVRDGSRRQGFFLPSGGLIYRDPLVHTEFCTPEVDHPDELVRQLGYGEHLLTRVAALGEGSDAVREISVSNINYCYATGQSFGSHENFSPSRIVSEEVIPFLATRFVAIGSGGFVPTASGIEFTMSPRIHFIMMAVSEGTQGESRGLYHLKNGGVSSEPRLHLITGEGCRSEWSSWLKFAITALVVEVLNEGAKIRPFARLAEPVAAAKSFALDPTGQVRATANDGTGLTAVEVQRMYLRLVEDRLAQLPDWAPLACARWAEVLDAFQGEGAPERLETRLDWAIKRNLVFGPHIARSGWTWESIAVFNAKVARLERLPGRDESRAPWLSSQAVMNPHVTFRAALDEVGIDHGELMGFARLREELCELDLRYHQFGPDSLFAVLEEEGCLDHRILESGAHGDPLDPPAPSSGRAALRGALVRKHGACGRHKATHFASWCHFEEMESGRMIDMSDASNGAENWKERPRRERGERRRMDPIDRSHALFRVATHSAQTSLDRGDLDQGLRALQQEELRSSLMLLPRQRQARYWSYLARIEVRRQAHEETLAALAAHSEAADEPGVALFEQAVMRGFLGLRGFGNPREWIERAEAHIATLDAPPFTNAPYYRSHAAIWLNRQGDPEAARALVEPILHDARLGDGYPNIYGRAQIAMSEVHRLSVGGDLDESLRLAEEAAERYRRVRYLSPLSDFALPQLAKVEAHCGRTERALEILREAHGVQSELKNASLLRTILLMARIDPSLKPMGRRRLRRKAEAIISKRTGFQQCPLARDVIYHWDDWCAGQPEHHPPGQPDFFRGV